MLQVLHLVSLSPLNPLVSLGDSALGVSLPKREGNDDYLFLLSDGFLQSLDPGVPCFGQPFERVVIGINCIDKPEDSEVCFGEEVELDVKLSCTFTPKQLKSETFLLEVLLVEWRSLAWTVRRTISAASSMASGTMS